MIKQFLGVLLIALCAFVFGYEMAPQISTGLTISWFYRSEVGNDLALGIKPDGTFEFGPKYNREIEVKKFITAAREALLNEQPSICQSASYSPLYVWRP